MKNICTTTLLTAALFITTGCDFNTSSEKADLDFLDTAIKQELTDTQSKLTVCQTDLAEEKLRNQDGAEGVIWEITDRIDTENVILNHYINEEKVEQNFADLISITVDDKTQVGTKNHITLPDYEGTPIKHTIIVQFTQIK